MPGIASLCRRSRRWSFTWYFGQIYGCGPSPPPRPTLLELVPGGLRRIGRNGFLVISSTATAEHPLHQLLARRSLWERSPTLYAPSMRLTEREERWKAIARPPRMPRGEQETSVSWLTYPHLVRTDRSGGGHALGRLKALGTPSWGSSGTQLPRAMPGWSRQQGEGRDLVGMAVDTLAGSSPQEGRSGDAGAGGSVPPSGA